MNLYIIAEALHTCTLLKLYNFNLDFKFDHCSNIKDMFLFIVSSQYLASQRILSRHYVTWNLTRSFLHASESLFMYGVLQNKHTSSKIDFPCTMIKVKVQGQGHNMVSLERFCLIFQILSPVYTLWFVIYDSVIYNKSHRVQRCFSCCMRQISSCMQHFWNRTLFYFFSYRMWFWYI